MNWSSLFSQFARPRRRRKGAALEASREPMSLRVETLEDRCVMAATPVVTAPAAVSTLIGESVSFDLTFDNTGTDVGYGPYIDLFLDTTGKDGVSPGTPAPANTYDGLTSLTATYLGSALPSVQLVTITGSTFIHPLTGEVTNVPGFGSRFNVGDTVAVLQLPFGSFTGPQTPATIHVTLGTSDLADLGAPLAITAKAGFRYGADAADNPGVDPPIHQAGQADTNVNLELWTVTKVYLGPEDETSTGPNFKREYRIDVDIATGQTIDNLTITDILNRSLQYTGAANVTAKVHGSTVANNLTSQPSVNDTAGSQTLTNNFGSVTGAAGVDASLQFQFFVTLNENDVIATPGPGDGPVLPQGTDKVTETNFATAAGDWDTKDTRDADTPVSKNSNTHTLEEQSIVTQKTVTVVDRNTLAPVPGGIITPGYTLLRYDIDFQVSDYFAFQNIFLQDFLSDGQRLYLGTGGALTPTLEVFNAYNSLTNTRGDLAAAAFSNGNIVYQQQFTTRSTNLSDPTSNIGANSAFSVLAPAPTSQGETFMQFNISNELATRIPGGGGKLVGGNVANGGGLPQTNNATGYGSLFSGTTGHIVFYAEVKDEFSDLFPSGDRSVDQLDVLSNRVPLIQGTQLDTTNLTTVIGTGTDDTGASVVIPIGDITKTLYAVNGQTTNLGQPVTVQPGDLVTYRITYTLPISSFEDLSLSDFLPLPVLPVPGQLTFDSTVAPGTIPVVNQITRGPGDTYFTTVNPFGAPVDAATTGNLAGYSTAGGGQITGVAAVDGVTLVNGNRVLVKNQTDLRQNGIYVFNSGTLTRAADFDVTSEIINSKLFRVAGGTVNGGLHFFQNNKLFTTLNAAAQGTDTNIQFTAFTQTDAAGNSFTLNFGTYDDVPFSGIPGNVRRSSTIDVLVTLRVADSDFAAELFLTNQVRISEGATNAPGQVFDQIVMFDVVVPNVNIYKGIVGYDLTGLSVGGVTFVNPSVSSNFTGTVTSGTGNTADTTASDIGAVDRIGNLDAGDEVRFGVVLQNTGRGDAYDVVFEDTLQPQYQTPTTAAGFAAATNLTVRRGDGTLLTGQLVDEYVRVASTMDLLIPGASFAAGTFSNVSAVMDGQTLAVGDHVLVKNQATASQNGLYSVTSIDLTDPANPKAVLARYGTFAVGYAVAVLGGLLSTNANRFFTAGAANGAGAWNLQGTTPGYYYTYEPVSRKFTLNLTDTYTAGNTTTDTQDMRSGGLSRGIAGGQNFFGATNVTVRVATVGNLGGVYDGTVNNGQLSQVPSTIDGVSLAVNDRVLVKDQADGRENGVYRVSAVSGGQATLVRDASLDTNAELASPFVAAASSGTVNGGKRFQTAGGVQLNVNPIQWSSERTYVGNGSDTVVVTYDLQLDTTAGGAQNIDPPAPGQFITNTAILTNVAKSEGGVKAPPKQDSAQVQVNLPQVQKVLIGTELNNPGNNLANQAVIGEIVTYEVTVTVPEGTTPSAALVDTLDPGMAFVDVVSVNVSGAVATSTGLNSANNGAANAATVAGGLSTQLNGRIVTFNLGTITNTDLNDATNETITIRYRAVVLNQNTGTNDANGNQAGNQRNNSAQFTWNGGADATAAVSAGQNTVQQIAANVPGPGSHLQSNVSGTATPVVIVEPTVNTLKEVQNFTQGGGYGSTISADNNDVVDYRITLSNPTAAAGSTTAYDVTLNDPLPATSLFQPGAGQLAIQSVSASGGGTITVTGGLLSNAFVISGNTLQLAAGFNIDMQANTQIVIVLRGTYAGSTGLSVPNTATTQWTSLDGTPGARSSYNPISVERTGADGLLDAPNTLNDYRTQSTATIEGPPLVYKTIVATSEANTAGPATNGAGPGLTAVEGAIGEIVRYRLYVSIGEGTTNNVQVQDFLPTGMTFLNDGTARYGFVTTAGTGISSATAGGATGLGTAGGIAGNGATLNSLSSSSLTGTFNDDNISPTSTGAGTGDLSKYANGQDVYFRFGTLTNSDNDTDSEFVVIEFNALVMNVSSNQAGTTLTNNFGVLVDTDASGTPGYISVVQDGGTTRGSRDASDTPQSANDPLNNGSGTAALSNNAVVTVVEPSVIVVKNVSTTSTTAGVTSVTYRVTVSNSNAANSADAFDVHLKDSLIASLDLQGTASNFTWGGLGTPGSVTNATVNNPVGLDTVELTLDRLLKGQTFSFDYTTIVTPGAEYPGATTIDNTVNVDYTSLPGTSGSGGAWTGTAGTSSTVPGASGDNFGERNGQDGKGGLNDYVDSDKQSLGSLGNRVFYDADGDGVQDVGEAGIQGVTVTLVYDANNNGTYGDAGDSTVTAVTGVDGKYLFNGLPLFFTNPSTGAQTAAKYRVSVPTTVAGMSVTDAFDNGVVSATASVTPVLTGATPGDGSNVQNRRDVDFGYRGTASIGDRVYIDADGDGVQDKNAALPNVEPNLPGVDLTLTWYGLDGVLGTSDDIVLTTKSGNPADPLAANYLFNFLPTGDYELKVSGVGGAGGVPSNMVLTDSIDKGGLANPTATLTLLALTAGEARTEYDFGYKGNAAIGDTVWYDADGDGTQQTGAITEPGIAGATVTLTFGGADGNLATAGDNVVFTTTTDSNGKYKFDGLPVWGAGSPYKVTVTPPAAYPTQTYDKDGIAGASANNSTLTLPPNTYNDLQDFGYRGTASLGDYVFEDFNGNGKQDGGDTGLQGVQVDLLMAGADAAFGTGDDIVVLSTTTDVNGKYAFNNLAAANYQVRFGAVPGYVRTTKDSPVATNDADDSDAQTSGVPALDGRTGTYSLALGATNNTIDAGYYRLQDIGDTIWYDVNNSGGATQDAGEVGIPNVKVTLDYAGLDGKFGGAFAADDQIGVASTTTDKFGNYLFADRIPGTYRVNVDPSTLPNGITVQTFDLDGTGTANSAVLALTSGADRLDADFSYTATGSLGDRIYIDADGDGVQDANGLEPSLPGVTVTLKWLGFDINPGSTYDDVVLTTVSTNPLDPLDPNYLFSHLAAGVYQVSVSAIGGTGGVPDNMTLTDVGDDGVLLPGSNVTLSLLIGENQTIIDFGYRGDSSIGDTVWYDADGDGVQQDGSSGITEPGIAGATVTLVWSGPNGTLGDGDDVVFTTVTDKDGKYLFTGLPVNGAADDYKVTVTPPTNFPVQTYDKDGIAGASANNSTLQLPPNTANLLQDFGYRGTAALGDFVWEDLNGNGRQDAGEPGLKGVTVDLMMAGADGSFGTGDDIVVLSTTTDVNGAYLFDNLGAANYQVRFGTLPGYVRTAQNSPVAATATNSDADQTTGRTGTYVLVNGSTNYTVDSGLYRLQDIGDTVWYDVDGAGGATQQAGEPGIPNVKVNLDYAGLDGIFGGANAADDVLGIASTVTDKFGAYLFADRIPGTYRVSVDPMTLPNGVTQQTFDLDGTGTANSAVLALTSGADRLDADFSYTATGSLGDRVYVDADGDGKQAADGSEPSLPGVGVTLTWAGFDGDFSTAFDNVTLTTTSTNSGTTNPNYLFTRLASGSYRVDVSAVGGTGGVPANMTLTDSLNNGTLTADPGPIVSLNIGQARTDVDFGYKGTASIGDTVWFDQDADGVQDPGEPGIPNVPVRAVWGGADGIVGGANAADDVVFTTVTDKDGKYTFQGLPTGPAGSPYEVTVTTPPANYSNQTFDQDGTGTPNASSLVLGPTEDNVDQDFGYRGNLKLGDYVWLDVDGDGVQDAAEEGLNGVVLTLTAVIDGNALTVTTTTAENAGKDGFYQFDNLIRYDSKGNLVQYTVTVSPATLPQTVDGPDGDSLPDPLANTYDLDGNKNDATTVAFTAGVDLDTLDFGYQGNGEIGDYVWLDVDGDGNQDSGEPGIANVGLQLTADVDGDGDLETFLTTTDSEGKYSFKGLPILRADGSGIEYTVTVLQNTLPQDETNNPIDNTFDFDGGLDAVSKVTLTPSAPVDGDQDFGFVGPGSIGDKVFLDVDGDGAWDVGEGINGVKLTLTGDFDGDGKSESFTTTTANDGTYTFPGLPVYDLDGNLIQYTVTVDPSTLPIDVTFTADPDGTLDGVWSGDLSDGPNYDFVDFGVQGPARLGDLVWIDANANGLLDGTESGITGVRIYLEADVNGDGTLEKFQAYTDSTGIYGFVGLPPRDKDGNTIQYHVIVDETTLPGGVEAVYDPDTATDPVNGVFGDNQSFLTFPAPTLAVPNPENLAQDFGYRLPGVIGDTIFLDVNNNGLPDPGEGLGGVTVQLTADLNGDGLNEIFTLTTDPEGKYNFTGLPFSRFDGSTIVYTVTVDPLGNTLPPGVLNSTDPDGGLDSTSTLTLSKADPVNNDQDFGYRGPKSIEGSVYIDLDQDGDRGDEPGIPGVLVVLVYTVDDDGSAGGPQKLERVTTYTDANGNYSFSGLPAFTSGGELAKYFVIQGEQPPQYLDGLDEIRGVVIQGTDYRPREILDELPFIEFNPDNLPEVVVRNNFGEYLIPELPKDPPITFPVTVLTVPRVESAGYDRQEYLLKNPNDLERRSIRREELEYASVEGVVFSDVNNNGAFNSNERGIPGVLVKLVGPSNRQAVTDDDGRYSFDQLPVGTYSIIEIRPNGMLRGKLSVGSAGGGTSDNAFTDVGLSAGQRGMNYNFGELPPAKVAGKSFLDSNRNGVQDPGEMGMPGVLVKVTGVDDRGAPVNVGAFTGWDGAFSVEDLRPGVYTVTQMPPPMFRNGPATAGPGGGTAGNGTVSGIEVTPAAAPGGMVFPVQMVDTPQNAAAPLRWLWGAVESPLRAFGLGQAGDAKPEKAAARGAEGKTSDARKASEGSDVARNVESSPYEAAAMGAIGLAGMLAVTRPAAGRRQTWEESVDRYFSSVGEDN